MEGAAGAFGVLKGGWKKAGKIAQAFGREAERGCPAWWRWGKRAGLLHPSSESGSDLRLF